MQSIATRVQYLKPDVVDDTPRYCDWNVLDVEQFMVFRAYKIEQFDLEKRRDLKSRFLVYPYDDEEILERYDDVECLPVSYWYPLPRTDYTGSELRDMAIAIEDLPLCIVYVASENAYGLALVRGGVNLSWEIAEAYIRLGYLPPLAFCDLPALATLRRDERTMTVIAACRRSIDIMRQRLDHRTEALDELEVYLP